jgi:uncharacterized RDD family membrane protein YckC
MSSPPVGSAGGNPEPNWYPDPSIPGYIRYWNGTAWAPGTSRPEPRQGESPPTPPHGQAAPGTAGSAEAGVAAPAGSAAAPPAEETGPFFFDQESGSGPGAASGSGSGSGPRSGPAEDSGEHAVPRQPAPGALPELRSRAGEAPAWTPDDDVSTSPVAAVRRGGPARGGDAPADPRTPFGQTPGGAEGSAKSPLDDPNMRDQTIGIRRAELQASWPQQVHEPAQQEAPAPSGPVTPPQGRQLPAQASPPQGTPVQASPPQGTPVRSSPPLGTETPQAPPPGTPPRGAPQQAAPAQQEPAPRQPAHASPAQPLPGPAQPAYPSPAQPQPGYGYPRPEQPSPGHPQPGYGYPRPDEPSAGQPQPGYGYPQPGQPAHPPPMHPLPGRQPGQPQPGQPQPGLPGQQQGGPAAVQPSPPTQSGVLGAPQMTPLTEVGLAVRGTAPWETPFGGSGQAYPSGLGRRLLARLIDALLPLAAAAAVAISVVDKARDHLRDKIDAIEQAGVTETVWLVDSTTGPYIAMVLGAYLVVGLLLEVVPTAIWGRTPGKRLCGIGVLDMSSQEKPGFGASLSRWLVHSLLALSLIGVLNYLWCLWDRPWRQCWHDKAARTFVASAKPRS